MAQKAGFKKNKDNDDDDDILHCHVQGSNQLVCEALLVLFLRVTSRL